ncbi:MAG: nucleotide exchange factor GrpE [Xanthomonadales bacterium]|nr:nucleotide exchange factor GrpE [Gammaproteobacteria bacterium]MBT8074174.1 nucleotide exchange factor GrpE [Gammaproteobacteria bacterium]NNK05026.1 nucleotide exchange factor GrpE [Xanthomonadales bacterium]NNK99718.1 nucleotide exchange factor GrpE [Xanthomonadales bacterium]
MTAQKSDEENVSESNEEELLAESGEDAGNETLNESPEETLESELDAAQLEAAEARQGMLRMQADMENLRKRLVREHEKSRRRTLERFMSDLLPVRDSLERGLEAAEDPAATVEALKEGKQLIMKMLTKAMGDHGLETIDPLGEPFNPEKHEAMTMLPSAEHAENTVIDVLEKGYQLHDRLIRPAKVVVSRKP